MAERYKLTYGHARGLAENIRYILALAEVEYEDHRLEKEEWPKVKPTTKWGQMPFIEMNGEMMGQSVAIARYLARKYNLAGETPMEEFLADELIDAFRDLEPTMRPIFMEQDELKKAELKKTFVESAKPFLEKLSGLKKKNGGKWVVGKNVTWADVYIANGLDWIKLMYPTVFQEYSVMKEIQENVFALPQIKKWIEIRPQTEM